jgi:elongation factor 1-alpha
LSSFNDLKLKNFSFNKQEKLATLFQFKLDQNGGEFSFILGVEDSERKGLTEEEMKTALINLETIVFKLDANFQVFNYCNLIKSETIIPEILVRRNNRKIFDKQELKVGLFGEEGSGKTTLVGVLVNNVLDNGEGSARHNMFRFSHEVLSGKTTSLTHQVKLNN